MKRLFGIVMALVIALSSIALAETVNQPVNPEDRYVLVRFEMDGEESFVLLGAGDGIEAFETFASEDELYAKRFESFWTTVSKMEPNVTVMGEMEEMSFESSLDGEQTVVSINGEAVAELDGLESFAIVSGSLEEVKVVADDDCEVRIWTSEAVHGYVDGELQEMNVCPNCGEFDDGSAKHHTVISAFCEAGHTQCMGDPIHHCDVCDRDYPCSKSNSHTTCIKCGKAWCYKEHGDHKELACGHRGCEVYGHEDEHAKCPGCDGYLCDGKDHTLAACGMHHADVAGDHTVAACGFDGHFNCDGKDHAAAACGFDGHTNCDGKDHAAAACGFDGHYNCDGKDHAAAACGFDGHYNCDGKDHAAAACGFDGHYNCDGKDHAAAACGFDGHTNCDGKDHAAAACGFEGHTNCDGKDHAATACGFEGHTNCDGKDHGICETCGDYLCNGEDHTACEPVQP